MIRVMLPTHLRTLANVEEDRLAVVEAAASFGGVDLVDLRARLGQQLTVGSHRFKEYSALCEG